MLVKGSATNQLTAGMVIPSMINTRIARSVQKNDTEVCAGPRPTDERTWSSCFCTSRFSSPRKCEVGRPVVTRRTNSWIGSKKVKLQCVTYKRSSGFS